MTEAEGFETSVGELQRLPRFAHSKGVDTVLKIFRALFGMFDGELPAPLMAYGLCLGLFFGFMPQGPAEFMTLIILSLLIFTRCSLGLFAISAVVSKLLTVTVLATPIAKTGRAILEMGSLQGVWTTLLEIPGIRLLDLWRYSAFGGFAWALLASAVLFWPTMKISAWAQESVMSKAGSEGAMAWLLTSFPGLLITAFFFGVELPDNRADSGKSEAKAGSVSPEGVTS